MAGTRAPASRVPRPWAPGTVAPCTSRWVTARKATRQKIARARTSETGPSPSPSPPPLRAIFPSQSANEAPSGRVSTTRTRRRRSRSSPKKQIADFRNREQHGEEQTRGEEAEAGAVGRPEVTGCGSHRERRDDRPPSRTLSRLAVDAVNRERSLAASATRREDERERDREEDGREDVGNTELDVQDVRGHRAEHGDHHHREPVPPRRGCSGARRTGLSARATVNARKPRPITPQGRGSRPGGPGSRTSPCRARSTGSWISQK